MSSDYTDVLQQEHNQAAPMSREQLISLCIDHLPQTLQRIAGEYRGRIHCDVMLKPGSQDDYCLRIALPESPNYRSQPSSFDLGGTEISMLIEAGRWAEAPVGTRIIHEAIPKLA